MHDDFRTPGMTMADIVERLRIRQPLLGRLCDEAADEIERLREELESAKAQVTIARHSNGFQLLDASPHSSKDHQA